MKSVMITGADGFLGRNLCRCLAQAEKGIHVYALAYPHADALGRRRALGENVTRIVCDLEHISDYDSLIPEGMDILYHLAWRGVHPEARDDLEMQLSNISMTMRCMEFAARKKVRAFLFPGSTNEYLYYGKPLDGQAVPTPRDAYGSVKVALRYICQQYARQHGMAFLYTIIAGIYAADRQDNNVIFYTIRKLLRGEKPSLTGLAQLWDYVYIDDVVEALRLLGEKGKDGRVYAIGHGDNWPLRNYIERIRDCIDPSLPLGIGEIPYREAVLPSSCIDLRSIREDTGFQPQVDFDTGIRRVIARIQET